MRVYLAGPINGCTDDEARGWREEVKRWVPGIDWVDPMIRDYRGSEAQFVDSIVHGDLDDIRTCDVVLVYAARPSWGTAMEVVYARQMGKTVLVWVPSDVPVSPWLRFHATEVLRSAYEVQTHLTNLALLGKV